MNDAEHVNRGLADLIHYAVIPDQQFANGGVAVLRNDTPA
jgi:hypothetical protein